MPRVFLYQGATSFPDPGDWNPFDNTVDCIGSGGGGDVGNLDIGTGDGHGYVQSRLLRHGASGGGGAFARGVRLTPIFPVPVSIAPPNTAHGAATTYTFFGGTARIPGNVVASCGQNGLTATGQSIPSHGMGGGPAGEVAYPLGYAGGFGSHGRLLPLSYYQTLPTEVPGVVMSRDAAGGGGSGGPAARGAGGGAIGENANTAIGGAPNAVLPANTNPLTQLSISATGHVDYIYGDGLHGVGGGGMGGAEVIVSASAPAGPSNPVAAGGGIRNSELWWDGATLRRWANIGGWVVRGGTYAGGSLNGANGGAYGGGGGGGARFNGGFWGTDVNGAPGNGAPGLIVITWTSYVPPPPGDVPEGWARVFLTGSGNWTPPDDWDGMGLVVECVGAGGAGSGGRRQVGDDYAGAGGGGGAYARSGGYDQLVSDLIPLTFPAPYWAIWSLGGAVNFGVGGTRPSTVRGCVSAQNGAAGAAAVPGAGGAAFFPAGYAGGNGTANYGNRGGGGGGSAGPNGPGGNAQEASLTQSGIGGLADGSNIGTQTSGTNWITHGVGGGGSGGTGSNVVGGAGALHGGGGGGSTAGIGTIPPGAAGGAGLIIVTYRLAVSEPEVTHGQTQIVA